MNLAHSPVGGLKGPRQCLSETFGSKSLLHGKLHIGAFVDANTFEVALVEENVLPIAFNEPPPLAQQKLSLHNSYNVYDSYKLQILKRVILVTLVIHA